MKKIIFFFSIVLLVTGCSSVKRPDVTKSNYDILTSSDYGGASFRFYETISEPDEFNILLSDDILKKYVKKEDINSANYILVNMGEKKSNGYSVEVVSVEELSDKVVVTLKEKEPNPNDPVAMSITNPYMVIKIKSKKPIELK